jgi:cytochrome c oxidase assembly protein subunit 15
MRPTTAPPADLLALGFGTTVAMWAAGYLLRLPPATTPAPAALALLALILTAGGLLTGRLTPRRWRGGLQTGALTSLLNLLILGSLLAGHGPAQRVPSALVWLPGSILAGALLGALGAALGARLRPPHAPVIDPPTWTAAFATVAATATFCLLIVGGIVTGKEAGLAVTDWPNSFGHNMFLFPLSRMTGPVFFEHAHRLFGSLVGLTSLVLALHLQRADNRKSVRRFALLALALVIVQGLLGGLRVTGRFTLSADPQQTAPSLLLAIIHGITGQLFFCAMVALAALTAPAWRTAPPPRLLPRAPLDHGLSRLLLSLLIVQLVLGAVLRHLAGGLMVHVSFAVIVIVAALITAVRAWAVHDTLPIVPRLGKLLLILIGLQLGLGVAALVVTGDRPNHAAPTLADVIVTTAHQANGAFLLAVATLLVLWLARLVRAPGGNSG